MPMHWDWDWDLHHDQSWHGLRTHFWPHWISGYHLKCPTQRRSWAYGNTEFDVCARDWHIHLSDTPWCHRSCLAGRVFIETGDEAESSGKGTFKVIIDVHHFRADELTLKVKNNDTLVLEGKQKDGRADKSSFCITREFTRKYKLPRNYDATEARATLSSDGILSVMVPAPPPLDDVERVLEIVQTGAYFGSSPSDKNAKAIEEKEGEEEHAEKAGEKSPKKAKKDDAEK